MIDEDMRTTIQHRLTLMIGLAERAGDVATVMALLRAKQEILDATRQPKVVVA